ncbi:hypothetical protein EW026_g7317 [Hermanssonia centrifuga]|uniref:ATP-dependent DNA helicase n=1 Tax=Hermanssonia centrifuga TaxID=98765 RepID=A0A4S4K876_9APHY|nr:hypothetical protein EW026_g7317 [Hermanssonia centrifuga]
MTQGTHEAVEVATDSENQADAEAQHSHPRGPQPDIDGASDGASHGRTAGADVPLSEGDNDMITLEINGGGRIFAKSQEVRRKKNLHIPVLAAGAVMFAPSIKVIIPTAVINFVLCAPHYIETLSTVLVDFFPPPWRILATDLKSQQQSWSEAFSQFRESASDRVIRILAGIQYYHDCKSAATSQEREAGVPLDDSEGPGVMGGDDETDPVVDVIATDTVVSEDAIARVLAQQTSRAELTHAKYAIEIAKGAKIFKPGQSTWTVTNGEAQMQADVARLNGMDDAIRSVPSGEEHQGAIERIEQVTDHREAYDGEPSVCATANIDVAGVLTAANPSMLKPDQFRAFDIIQWHLHETLAGNEPPPLRMVLYGEGGTGKSKVIQTVTEEFVARGAQAMLVKAAYTGVAASLIDGKTTHTIAALRVKRGDTQTVSDRTKAKLQSIWKDKRYLIVDEFSMLGKSHLVRMERSIAIETDLDLTNGSRGTIVEIVLHEDEPPLGTDPVVHLQYLPAYVLVKMARTRASKLKDLEEGVIPVEPAKHTMQIKLDTRAGKSIKRTVHRRQFPITPAYAFTDYRSQGQTLPYVIVDIASPPTGTLSLFNLYVALSRSSGRDTIRLLRDFDDQLFRQAHDPELLIEDERLEALDLLTKQWWQQMGGEARQVVTLQQE